MGRAEPLDMAEGGNESLGDQSVGAARNNNTSYTNLYAVDDPAGEGGKRLYNFSRQLGWDPTVATSLDGGRSWVQLGRLLSDPGDDPRTRPYAQYTAGGDRVDFIVTDGHPDSIGSSAYHGYLRGGQVHDSYGRVLARSATPSTSADSRPCCAPGPPAARAGSMTTCGSPTSQSTR